MAVDLAKMPHLLVAGTTGAGPARRPALFTFTPPPGVDVLDAEQDL